MMVRLSPDERRDFEAKAARARLNKSDAAREAFRAWQPGDGGGNAIRNSGTGTGGIRVEYDEPSDGG